MQGTRQGSKSGELSLAVTPTRSGRPSTGRLSTVSDKSKTAAPLHDSKKLPPKAKETTTRAEKAAADAKKKGYDEIKAAPKFRQVQRRFQAQVASLVAAFGEEFDKSFVQNVVTYVKLLPRAESPLIDKTIFGAQMLQLFGISHRFYIEQMYRATWKTKELQTGVSILEYCRLLLTFLSCDGVKKTDFVFDVYDMHHTGGITRKEVTFYMRNNTIIKKVDDEEEHEENLNFLVQTVMDMIDVDDNGILDREEFQAMAKKEGLMRQCLGTCLPDTIKIQAFRKMLEGKTTFQIVQNHRFERRNMLRYQAVRDNESYIQSLYPVTLELQ